MPVTFSWKIYTCAHVALHTNFYTRKKGSNFTVDTTIRCPPAWKYPARHILFLYELGSFMHYFRFLFTFLFFLIIVLGCKTTPPVQLVKTPPVLVEIGTEQFSPEDFQESYTKNRFASDSAKGLTPQEYLPLYTDLKIKVMQARSEGRDTAAGYKEEINSYREQLAKNFLVDKSLVEKLTVEAYNRLKQEIRVSHILIPVSEFASPEDTLQAYRAALAMRGRLEEGADFGEMASKFSKDPTAVQNRGDLGYNTVFQTIYALETSMYNLPVGKLSQPVRTRAGYHILKVTDKRPNRGTVKVAHIMARLDARATESQKQQAKAKIDAAYSQLQQGADWDATVEQYSEDRESAKNQGLLPIFGTGQMVSEVEEAAFSLTKLNTYSKPVLSPYGWHIIKLVEKRSLETYAVMSPSLKQKVMTDSRGKLLEQTTVRRLKEKLTIKEFPDQWALLKPLVDSSLITGKWDYMKPVTVDWSQNILFSIEKNNYDALMFLSFVRQRQQPQAKDSSPMVIFQHYYQDFMTDRLLRYEREHLEETSVEFRSTMNEIREGVLLSQVMEDNVWQRALSDSIGQRNFYNLNASRYNYPERALATVVTAADTQVINKVKKTLEKAPYLLERKGNEIIFKDGASELSGEATERQLNDLYVILAKNPEYVVEVSGYRLPSEDESISALRIRNVVKFLTSKNISIIRIIEKDYGSFRQSAEVERNRRVGFQFFSQSKKDVERAYNSGGKNIVNIEEGYFPKSHPLLANSSWSSGEQLLRDAESVRWISIEKIEAPRAKSFAEAQGTVINEYQKELEKQWLQKLHQKFPVKVNEGELDKIKR
jgi:peptidyl-prolyl cis-trans isomerase SurA